MSRNGVICREIIIARGSENSRDTIIMHPLCKTAFQGYNINIVLYNAVIVVGVCLVVLTPVSGLRLSGKRDPVPHTVFTIHLPGGMFWKVGLFFVCVCVCSSVENAFTNHWRRRPPTLDKSFSTTYVKVGIICIFSCLANYTYNYFLRAGFWIVYGLMYQRTRLIHEKPDYPQKLYWMTAIYKVSIMIVKGEDINASALRDTAYIPPADYVRCLSTMAAVSVCDHHFI